MGLWFRRRRKQQSRWGRGAVFMPGTCAVQHRTRAAARRCRTCGCTDSQQVDLAQAQAQMALNQAAAELARSQVTKALAAEW